MSNHPDTVIISDWFEKNRRIENIPQPAFIVIDRPWLFSKDLPNVYIQVEPNAIINQDEYLIQNHAFYHTIITFNENILKACPNAKKYIQGTSWIPETQYNNIDLSKKKYQISNLAGSKKFPNAPGHSFRQEIHHNQSTLKDFPITFFRSYTQKPHIKDYGNNPLLINDKLVLFDEFQFAIVIENSRQQNQFTEKIMDCLLTKTIPIQQGCPNIDEFFDTTGWIILEDNSLSELICKLSVLDESQFYKQIDIVQKNFNQAQKYKDLYTNINNAK